MAKYNADLLSDEELIKEMRARIHAHEMREIETQRSLERINSKLTDTVTRAEWAELCGKLMGQEMGEKKSTDTWKWIVGIVFSLASAALAIYAVVTGA